MTGTSAVEKAKTRFAGKGRSRDKSGVVRPPFDQSRMASGWLLVQDSVIWIRTSTLANRARVADGPKDTYGLSAGSRPLTFQSRRFLGRGRRRNRLGSPLGQRPVR